MQMTPAQRAYEEALARKFAAMGDEGEVTAGVVPFLAAKFPIPDTTGMTPAEAEATLDKWRAEVAAFEADQKARSDAWWAAKSAGAAAP